ncbi:excisionase family DNA-binding protein [Paracoccus aerius]|uniref:Excisionase family DNA-binding protein n=1 Tax=Paracoccus aerius TaxID=1915382 RepID=A0ABS1S0N4_9RHOB|nr:excisionase family DNA-binding protein [Paracoccus aerius]
MDQRRPYTPGTLAERWGCSAETIRAMIRRGELPAFRVGRMMRIPAEVVDAHEGGTGASQL